MAGHGSGNAPGGGIQPLGLDPASIDAFANSGAGKKYTPDQVELLKYAQTQDMNGRYHDMSGSMDLTGIVGEFQNWKKMTSSSNAAWDAYTTAAQNAPGRDATILTGPAKTALGS